MIACYGVHVVSVCRHIKRIGGDIAKATFVPPCAHEWRKVAETVTPPIENLKVAYDYVPMAFDAMNGSTTLVLACDKCGATQTQTVKGAPR